MTMLEPAIAYALQGQPVFPCVPHGDHAKSPMTIHGLKDATTGLGQIQAWWDRWPWAAIGLRTGILWDVIDVDCKPGGVNGKVALEALVGLGLIWPGAVRVATTPSGGRHIYFPASGTMRNGAFPSAGIDLRGNGGYVIAPPSVLFEKDGSERGVYTLTNFRDTALGAPLDHERVKAILRPKRQAPITRNGSSAPREGGIGALETWLRSKTPGGRNDALWWASRAAIESGLDPHLLEQAAQDIGLGDEEIQRTINSATNHQGATA